MAAASSISLRFFSDDAQTQCIEQAIDSTCLYFSRTFNKSTDLTTINTGNFGQFIEIIILFEFVNCPFQGSCHIPKYLNFVFGISMYLNI